MTPARLRVAAGVVLAATSLSACGGSGSPEGSSTGAFCEAYNSLFTAFAAADPNDNASAIKALKDWVKRMKDVGTPNGIPADAQRGLALIIKTAEDLDANATQQELNHLGSSFTAAQQKDGDAFNAWATQECPHSLDEPSGTS